MFKSKLWIALSRFHLLGGLSIDVREMCSPGAMQLVNAGALDEALGQLNGYGIDANGHLAQR